MSGSLVDELSADGCLPEKLSAVVLVFPLFCTDIHEKGLMIPIQYLAFCNGFDLLLSSLGLLQ